MNINEFIINNNHEPFIIAEMSGNHNQSLERAVEIIHKASESGAHAIKLQTYTADTITLNVRKKEFLINDKNSLWYGESLYDLYNNAHTPWEWHEKLFEEAKKVGIICFTSPFSESAVDFLEDLNTPAYKIASFENSHLPLIKKIAATKKPIIISSGLATISELDESVKIIREYGCDNFAILKCTSSYPANPKHSNILSIPHMKKLFGCEIGLSDHTMGLGASIAAVSHGASIIEKHFTLKRSDGGVDSAFSLEPAEMEQLVVESKRAWESLGEIKYGPNKDDKNSLIFRRSVYISKNVKKGDKLTKKNLKVIRPGLGLAPKYYNILIGKKINKDAKKGTPFSWEFID